MHTPIDLPAFEATLDCISGASLYVTRACVENIGLMDERFFLYYEDADWSARAKRYGLGYAPDSIVPHRGGTTIGSARAAGSKVPPFSVSRKSKPPPFRSHALVRDICPWRLFSEVYMPSCILLLVRRRTPRRPSKACWPAIKGETGQPGFHELMTKDSSPQLADNSKRCEPRVSDV